MEPTNRIIAAVDLSGISPAVVAKAESLAAGLGCGVRVLNVAEPMAEEEGGSFLLPILRRWAAETQKGLEEDFRRFCDGLPPPRQGVERECVFSHGKAHSEIIRHLRIVDSPLLVIGAPSPTALTGTVFGRVLRRTPVPVLVVRNQEASKYRRVLVGVDFSPCSEGALRMAGTLAAEDAFIKVMNVIPKLSSDRLFEDLDETIEQHKEELGKISAKTMPGRAAELEVSMGSARVELLEKVESGGFDLVAVGVSASLDIADIFLGSVADAVARHSVSDVLIYSTGRVKTEPARAR